MNRFHSLKSWWCFRAVGLCVPLCFGEMLERSDSQSFGCSLQHLRFLKEQMQFKACPTIFLLPPLSTWNLNPLYAQCRAKAVKNYSLSTFSIFKICKSILLPSLLSLVFQGGLLWGIFIQIMQSKDTGASPLCRVPFIHLSFLSCLGWPWPLDLRTTLFTQSPLLMFFYITRGNADFETQVYYSEQGLRLLNYHRCQHGKLQVFCPTLWWIWLL